MAKNRPWKLKAVQMAKQGKSITRISKELDVEWLLVHRHVRATQHTKWSGWVGAKRFISYRLKKMAAADDAKQRECLEAEISDAINYLYYAGKGLGKSVDQSQ